MWRPGLTVSRQLLRLVCPILRPRPPGLASGLWPLLFLYLPSWSRLCEEWREGGVGRVENGSARCCEGRLVAQAVVHARIPQYL